MQPSFHMMSPCEVTGEAIEQILQTVAHDPVRQDLMFVPSHDISGIEQANREGRRWSNGANRRMQSDMNMNVNMNMNMG
jgi:hypothetical protein